MNTKIINLLGGPGTGKSTTASYIYYLLKDANVNAELVREYVKDWVWQDRKVTQFDQPYLLGKQLHREASIYGKVDYIVTDSPLILSIYYARYYSPPRVARGIEDLVMGTQEQLIKLGHCPIYVLLRRSKPYNPAGRYQDEEHAKGIDVAVQDLLDSLGIKYYICGTPRDQIESLVKGIRDEFDGKK